MSPVHRLFVNLLPMSFYDTTFIELEAGNLLSAAGLTPANIVFEITERLAIENFSTFRRALASYTAMGFGVAIDDVGTRHANLETVMSLRPHFIKISDVLIRGVSRSPVKREMLRSLGRIAEAVDAVVVSEGIETIEDLACLRDLGLRYGQGYYMARPAAPFPSLVPGVYETIRDLATSPLGVQLDDDDDHGFEASEPPVLPRIPRTHRAASPAIDGSAAPFAAGGEPVRSEAFARKVIAAPELELIDEGEEVTKVADSTLTRRARGSDPPGDIASRLPRFDELLAVDSESDEQSAEPLAAPPAELLAEPLAEPLMGQLRKRPSTENQGTDPAMPRPPGLN
jgi:EAL domain